MNVIRVLLAVAIVLLCAGCATREVRSPMLSAFQRLVNEVDVERTDIADYSSTVSINGLGRQDLIGDTIYFPGKRLSDHFALTIAPGLSVLQERRFDLKNADAKGYKDPDAAVRSKCFVSVAGLGEEAVILAIRDMYACARSAIVEAAAKQALWVTAQLGAAVTDERRNTFMKAVLGVNADSKIEGELTKVRDAAVEAERQANLAMADVKRGIRARNIVLAKWSTRRDVSGGGGIGAIFGASGRKATALTGILILGGLRVTTLQPGLDFLLAIKREDVGRNPLAGFYRDLQIPMYSLQAKYQAYVQDIDVEAAFEASLSVSVQMLMQIAGGTGIAEVLKGETVKLGARITELASIGDAGYVTPSGVYTRQLCFHEDGRYAAVMRAELADSAEYSNVYTVRSTPGKDFYDRHLGSTPLVWLEGEVEKAQGGKGVECATTRTQIWKRAD